MYTLFAIDPVRKVEILLNNKTRRFVAKVTEDDQIDIYRYGIQCNYNQCLVDDLNKLVSGIKLDTRLVMETICKIKYYLHEYINQNNLYNIPGISVIETDHGSMLDVSEFLSKLGLLSYNKLFNLYTYSSRGKSRIISYEVYLDTKYKQFLSLLKQDVNNKYYVSKYLVLYNIYTSKLELCFFDNSIHNHLLHSVECSIKGFVLETFNKPIQILNSGIFYEVLRVLDKDYSNDVIDSKVIEAVNKKYDINKPYSEISSLDELSMLYHIKYPVYKLEELLNKYNTKIDLLRAGNPGITHLDLKIIGGKVILDRIITGKSNISITIPDWVWGYTEDSSSILLPDCVVNAEIKFTRPIPYSELFSSCTYLKSLKLYGLDIRFSNTDSMFENCPSLSELYFDEVFDLQESESSNYMLYDCKNLYYKNIHSENRFRLSSKCLSANLMFLFSKITDDDIADWSFKERLYG